MLRQDKVEPWAVRPAPSKRLDKEIREAVLQYGWDSYEEGDTDDPLLRIVLLCRARSRDWSGVLKKAIARSDMENYNERLTRHLVGDTASAQHTRDEMYKEMASRLVDPMTLQPVDITGMGPLTLAREVADGNIQLDYVVSNDAAFRERI